MAIIVSFVSPSEYFLYNFLNYLYVTYQQETNDEIKQWAAFILIRTLRTLKANERTVLPQMEELKSIELRRKIFTEVFFCNGASEVYFMESYSTIEDLKREVAQRYELEEQYFGYFGILEYCKKNEIVQETFVEDHIKIQDVISSWFNEVEFLTKMMKEETLKLKFRLYFKLRFDFQSEQLTHKVL